MKSNSRQNKDHFTPLEAMNTEAIAWEFFGHLGQ